MSCPQNLTFLVSLWSLGVAYANSTTAQPPSNPPLASPRTAHNPNDSFDTRRALPLSSVSEPFSLPYSFRAPGGFWNSRDLLGKRSFLMLIGGPVLFQNEGEKSKTIPAQSQFETPVSPNGLEKIAVLSRHDYSTAEIKSSPASGLTLLHDMKGKLTQRYNNRASGFTFVAVDKAGFLRRVEAAPDFAAALHLLSNVDEPTPQLEIGLPAPDFSMPDMNGKTRRVSDLHGRKNLLLTFFPKCFTYTCTKQLTSLQTAQTELVREDTEVWAVSVDTVEGLKGQRAFAKHLKLTFPFIPDTGRNLSILYGAAQSPNQFAARVSILIDKRGIVRWIEKQMNPRTHGSDVLVKVRSLKLATAKQISEFELTPQ